MPADLTVPSPMSAPEDRPGSTTVATTTSAGEERSLADALARILRDHPDADPAAIAGQLRAAHCATAGAKVQGFRVVLAERSARASLRRPPSPAAPRG